MIGVSAYANYEWALRKPGTPPFIILTEFPRSGGNWVRDMLGDALQLPVPRFSRWPITFRSIIHSHDHRPTNQKTVYVVRDPRDIFVSHFHKNLTALKVAPPKTRKRILRIHPSLKDWANYEDVIPLMSGAYFEEWITRPLGVRVSWREHVDNFLNCTLDTVTLVRYEDMRENPILTLSETVTSLTGHSPDQYDIEFAVKRNTFERQTGRKTGQIDNNATKRRGEVGGWHDELPEELAKRIFSLMSEQMIAFGYKQ